MTRRTEGPWAAKRPTPMPVVKCKCGEWTHSADGVCSEYCRIQAQAQEARA